MYEANLVGGELRRIEMHKPTSLHDPWREVGGSVIQRRELSTVESARAAQI
jgi:hypothetical protein